MGRILIIYLVSLSCGSNYHLAKTNRAQAAPNGFSLTSPLLISTVSYQIMSCASGLSLAGTTDQASQSFSLYLDDKNCRLKVSSFHKDGNEYRLMGDIVHLGFVRGDVYEYRHAESGKTLYLHVDRQLSSPIIRGESASFSVVELAQGSDRQLLAVNVSTGVFVGRGKKNLLTVAGTEIVGVREQDNTLQFLFTLLCIPGLKEVHNPETATCNKIPLHSLAYRLVADTFDGVPCKNDNLAACESIFDGSEAMIDFQTDFVAPSPEFPGGGFVTTQEEGALVGPVAIHRTPQMIFIIKSISGGKVGYRYFNIDLQVSNSF